MKLDKTWKLPKPDKTESGYVWHPVVRVGRQVPFGYSQDPNDKDIIIPIPEAKKYLKQYSYRDVANWLSDQSGRHISHVGLYKRVRLEQKRKREAANQRYLAERYKAALDKAEKIEAQIRGGREKSSPAEA